MALNLRATLGLDGSGFELGIKRAQSQASKFASNVRSGINSQLGQFLAVTALAALTKKTIDAGGRINDLSEQLGISTDALQQWDFAAKQSGSTAEKVAGFFEKLAEAREAALTGDEGKAASFKAFGVSDSDLKSMSLQDLGLKIGNAVKDGDVQKLVSSLRDVGGRGSTSLVAAFKAGLEDAFGNAPIITAERIIELDRIGDEFQLLGLRLQAAFAPAILFLGNGLRNAMSFYEKWIGGIAAFYGALSGGASAEEAGAIGRGQMTEIENQQKETEKAIQNQIDAIKNRGKGPADFSSIQPKAAAEKGKDGATASASNLQLNSLQQIGGKVSFSPMQNAILENTKAVRENTAMKKRAPQSYDQAVSMGGVQYQ